MAVVSSAEAGERAATSATILQLRAPHLTARSFEVEAARLVSAVTVAVMVSSRCDAAVACDAAGVHLPERDIPTRDARALLGARLVGRSVHSIASAIEAESEGADYVIFGPVWPSSSHPAVASAGIDALAQVAAALHIPVLAIGGVTSTQRITDVAAAGAAGYASISLFA